MAEVVDQEAEGLVLGWRVTRTGDPSFWLNSGAAPGTHTPEDLVRVNAAFMGTHTAIIAQSGSGKSHFLGRLIEEIAIATKARCLLLDPNADFVKIDRSQDSRLWREANYDAVKRRGSLPHDTHRRFREHWSGVPILIRSNRILGKNRERIKIWWPNIASDLLAEDVDPMRRSEVYHCHAFVGAVAELVVLVDPEGTGSLGAIDAAEQLISDHQQSRVAVSVAIEKLFPRDALARAYEKEWSDLEPGLQPTELRETTTAAIDAAIKKIETAVSYVSLPVGRYYFSKAREYSAAGVLRNRPPLGPSELPRVTELDLASLQNKNTRMLA